MNAIIGGSDSAISVRFGGASPDAVNVRGSANEVKHVIAEINKIYDAAKRDEVNLDAMLTCFTWETHWDLY